MNDPQLMSPEDVVKNEGKWLRRFDERENGAPRLVGKLSGEAEIRGQRCLCVVRATAADEGGALLFFDLDAAMKAQLCLYDDEVWDPAKRFCGVSVYTSPSPPASSILSDTPPDPKKYLPFLAISDALTATVKDRDEWRQEAENWKTNVETLEKDNERLLRGEFTDDELQGFCHHFDERDRQSFCDGCTAYQRKLFGLSREDELRLDTAAEDRLASRSFDEGFWLGVVTASGFLIFGWWFFLA